MKGLKERSLQFDTCSYQARPLNHLTARDWPAQQSAIQRQETKLEREDNRSKLHQKSDRITNLVAVIDASHHRVAAILAAAHQRHHLHRFPAGNSKILSAVWASLPPLLTSSTRLGLQGRVTTDRVETDPDGSVLPSWLG